MLLRKIEAYGFKSFADRIDIELGLGVTAVVGPNGSGKSNIADAIRWALGEQSIRSLRGTKMEDVIFAGSDKRRPLGVAEVSLTFDNSDGTLPLDFTEVIVTRRVFRSGEGEYFINKAPCRLKDIHELFADTGLGREAMAIIGQNKVDEILNSKPEERRLLFEEAAGITKYKQRKKEALRKLDDTEQNLTRLADILTEIQSQLVPLAESAERTKTYNQLSQQLKECQVTVLIAKLEQAETMLETAKFGLTELNIAELNMSTRLNKDEIEQEQFTQVLAKANEQLQEDDQLIIEVRTEIERLEGQSGILQERITHSQLSQERVGQEVQRMKEQLATILHKLDVLNNNIIKKRSDRVELASSLSSQNLQYEQTCAAIVKMQVQLEESRDMSFDHMQDIVTKRNEYRSIEKDMVNNRQKQDKIKEELQQYIQEQQVVEVQSNALTSQMVQAKEELLRIKKDSIQTENEKTNYGQELTAKLSARKKITDEIQSISARCKALTAMQNEFEGFGRGIKHILKSKELWRSGVCGAVAQLITVPNEYVTAIEIALGGALQNLVTENEQVAQQAIGFLKSQHLGRATFLPLSAIKPFKPKMTEEQAAKEPGALGFAAQLISCDPKYDIVIAALLGRTIIAKNMDEAIKIAKKNHYGIKIVTLDGEIITPGGAMTGGSVHRKEGGFIGRNNEIVMMQTRITALSQQLQLLQTDISRLEQHVESINEYMTLLQIKLQKTEVSLAQLRIHIEQINNDSSRVKLAIATTHEEIKVNEEYYASLETRLLHSKQEVAKLETKDIEYKDKVVKWQEQLTAYNSAKEELSASLTQVQIAVNSIENEINVQKSGVEELLLDKTKITEQIQKIEQEGQALVVQMELSQNQIQHIDREQSLKATEKQKIEDKRKKDYEIKISLLSQIQAHEKEMKETRRKLGNVQNRLREASLLSAKYEYEVKHCLEELAAMSLTRENAQQYKIAGELQELSTQAGNLEFTISNLGTINPSAIEEYCRVNEREQFLHTQSHDLIEGKNYLLSVIKEIDETMSCQFNLAFQQINNYFGEIFIRLFGGGKALLKLIEPDNTLESGVDIIIQLPGKKLQHLAGLSGGERALTVIALLFALLEFRPAPFCVLDEIDAALDEANVNRFGDFLRDYGEKTQFVIVTHRKGTMEIAKVMHGVTMEESGVSKLLSVKFMDKAI